MYTNVTGETPTPPLPVPHFGELFEKRKPPNPASTNPVDYTQGYVYGLKGIRQLFSVSHATAQRYKDTFLKPAVKQNGRKIVVDKAKAIELFDQYNK